MPLYSYKCIPNEHFFEVRQRFADDPITECPECGGETRKVISSVGVVFKGSGFYINDSRKNGKGGSKMIGAESDNAGNKSAKDETDKKEPSKSKSDSTSEKPTAKAESKSEKAIAGNKKDS